MCQSVAKMGTPKSNYLMHKSRRSTTIGITSKCPISSYSGPKNDWLLINTSPSSQYSSDSQKLIIAAQFKTQIVPMSIVIKSLTNYEFELFCIFLLNY